MDILAKLKDPRYDGPLNAESAAEIERLRAWQQLAFNLWQQLSADSTDDIAKRAISKFMRSVVRQIECEQEAAEAAKET